MRKKIILSLLIIISLFIVTGCDNKKIEPSNQNNGQPENNINNSNEVISQVKVIINNKEYTLNLEDNATSRKLVELLPLETKMQELNGNEKYVYLSESFPTDSYKPERINKGDVMLFDNSCIVIFYKSFDNKGYNYTKIGHIDNLDDLGSGDVQVKFSK